MLISISVIVVVVVDVGICVEDDNLVVDPVKDHTCCVDADADGVSSEDNEEFVPSVVKTVGEVSNLVVEGVDVSIVDVAEGGIMLVVSEVDNFVL